MPRQITKVCPECGEEKPLDAFAIRDKVCELCREKIIKAWQQANAGKSRSIPTDDEGDPS